MIKSRQNPVLIPLIILMAFGSGLILFIVYVIIRTNLNDLLDFGIITLIIFLSSMAILPLTLVFSVLRQFKIHDDKLEVIYVFGLIRSYYKYEDLVLSDYTWTTRGLLIQTTDGDQMTIGEKQYKNYIELRQALQEKIEMEVLKLKYTTRLTRTVIVICGVITTLVLIALKLN